jgi:hypothetical protein
MLLLAVGFLGLSLLDGCGGGTLKPHTTAVIVQATSGQTQHTASLTVIVDY